MNKCHLLIVLVCLAWHQQYATAMSPTGDQLARVSAQLSKMPSDDVAWPKQVMSDINLAVNNPSPSQCSYLKERADESVRKAAFYYWFICDGTDDYLVSAAIDNDTSAQETLAYMLTYQSDASDFLRNGWISISVPTCPTYKCNTTTINSLIASLLKYGPPVWSRDYGAGSNMTSQALIDRQAAMWISILANQRDSGESPAVVKDPKALDLLIANSYHAFFASTGQKDLDNDVKTLISYMHKTATVEAEKVILFTQHYESYQNDLTASLKAHSNELVLEMPVNATLQSRYGNASVDSIIFNAAKNYVDSSDIQTLTNDLQGAQFQIDPLDSACHCYHGHVVFNGREIETTSMPIPVIDNVRAFIVYGIGAADQSDHRLYIDKLVIAREYESKPDNQFVYTVGPTGRPISEVQFDQAYVQQTISREATEAANAPQAAQEASDQYDKAIVEAGRHHDSRCKALVENLTRQSIDVYGRDSQLIAAYRDPSIPSNIREEYRVKYLEDVAPWNLEAIASLKDAGCAK